MKPMSKIAGIGRAFAAWMLIAVCASAANAEEATSAEIPEQLTARLLGSWGLISSGGIVVTDATLRRAVRSCRSRRTIPSADFTEGAAETLPEEEQRSGNLAYYVTDKGLQRIDLALRKVHLITGFEEVKSRKGNIVWKLSSTKGSVLAGFGVLRRQNIKAEILIEANAIYLRCSQPASKS